MEIKIIFKKKRFYAGCINWGMDRLERHYINEAERFGIDLRVYTGTEMWRRNLIKKIVRIKNGNSIY